MVSNLIIIMLFNFFFQFTDGIWIECHGGVYLWINKEEGKQKDKMLGWSLIGIFLMVMSLPIRYSSMAFYFRLSIIFLTPEILRHPLRRCDLLQPSREPLQDHHRLYSILIAPLVWYHIGDFPYDLQTTLLYFPFLVSFLLPDAFCHGLTDHRLSHCMIWTLPYVSPHMNLVLVLLIVCI